MFQEKTAEQVAALNHFYDDGMTSAKAKDLIQEAISVTGLSESQIKVGEYFSFDRALLQCRTVGRGVLVVPCGADVASWGRRVDLCGLCWTCLEAACGPGLVEVQGHHVVCPLCTLKLEINY